MKKLILLIIGVALWSNEFYSKLSPIYSYNVKSTVSGQIVTTNDKLEKSFVNKAQIIKINDDLNQVELKESRNQLKNLQTIYKLQEATYNNLNNISSTSKLEKDTQKIQVLNTLTSISDLKIKIKSLEDMISHKNITIENLYLDSIMVNVGDFVNPGSPLYTAHDLSKGKLEIYLPIKEADLYLDKSIYIDGLKTDYKIDKLSKVADDIHISSYKAEIIVDDLKNFSKLFKIEFK